MRNLLSSGSGLAQQQGSVLGSGIDVNQLGSATAAMLPYLIPNLAAYYDFTNRNNLTVDASNRVSQANDISGNNRHLLQATGSAQPLLLPWSGTNYGYLPGVSGNYLSTPNAAANRITGDIDFVAKIAADDWTPAITSTIIGKRDTGQNAYQFRLQSGSTGNLQLVWWKSASSIVATSTSAPVVADGAILWVRATLDVDNGASGNTVTFYTSTDGTNWTPLGSPVVTAGVTSIDATTAEVDIGNTPGFAEYLFGKAYYAEIRNGINGAAVVKFDASQATNNASSWVSSTGETWTVASTGSKPAQVVGKQSLLFDGSAYYMQTGAFTLAQPCTVVFVGKQNVWTNLSAFTDGTANASLQLLQITGTPQVAISAGTASTTNSNLAVGANGIFQALFNGASSQSRVNRLALVAPSNAGTTAANGLTLGCRMAAGSPTGFSAIQTTRILIFNTILDTATLDRIAVWAGKQDGITV